MSGPASQKTQTLTADIQHAHENVGGLEQALRAIDNELEALNSQSEQYLLLEQAYESLQKLAESGVTSLFWGERTRASDAEEFVDQIRKRIDKFHHSVADTGLRRQVLIDGVKEGQEVLDILEEDLFEERVRQRDAKQAWTIEREIDFAAIHPQILPSMRGGEDDRRFRKTLAATVLVSLLIGLLLPMIDLPIPERDELIEVPERLARLLREEQIPLPPVEAKAPPAEDEVVPESEEEPVVAEVSEPIEAPQPEETPEPSVAQQEPAPEERVRSTGILAFRESFADLASSGPSTQLGLEARISDAGEAAVGRTERSMVTTEGPGSSGGINLASLSRDVGGDGGGGQDIAGVPLNRVASSIVGGSPDRPLSAGRGAAGRTDEEIQIVFDRYKSAFYRLYNRELRNDPTLRGQVVLRLRIEPDGSVSLCEAQSSDLNSPALVQQVVDRVKTLDFGAKEGILAITILYPIDFLPAA